MFAAPVYDYQWVHGDEAYAVSDVRVSAGTLACNGRPVDGCAVRLHETKSCVIEIAGFVGPDDAARVREHELLHCAGWRHERRLPDTSVDLTRTPHQ